MPKHHLVEEIELARDETIEVEFESRVGANVLLMNDKNYDRYLNGEGVLEYRGGWHRASESPAVLKPPRPGKWNLVIDLGGRSGRLHIEFKVWSRDTKVKA